MNILYVDFDEWESSLEKTSLNKIHAKNAKKKMNNLERFSAF